MITYQNNIDALVPNVIVPGRKFYVSSLTGKASNGGSKNSPVHTINAALDLCTASKGDYIYCLPGHTESVSAAGGIALDVAGVTIVGLGNGSLRPTITLAGAATASITVTAANVTIDNFICVANLDNVATCFTTSAKDCTIQNIEFRDTSDALHFYSCVVTSADANGSDGLAVLDCHRRSLAALAAALVSILEATDRVRIQRNFMCMDAMTADAPICLLCGAFVTKDLQATDNICIAPVQTGIAVGQFGTGSSVTSSGVMARNYVASTDTAAGLFITAAWVGFGLFNNLQTGVMSTSGTIWPVVDTPS
jgi:hypothetical protein